jgi:hypothetical protein
MDMWVNYFSSTSAIASSLTGLIFVGLSVNVKKIFCITKAHLPSRAFGSLILLTNIVIVSNLCLVPAQPVFWLGCEILIAALAIWIMITRLDVIGYRKVHEDYKRQYFRSLFYSQLSLIPFLAAGACFIIKTGNPYYMLIPGIIFSLMKSLVDIWFLIVDINR